jgi:hypothetical protein
MDDDPRPWNEALRDQVRAMARAAGTGRPRRALIAVLEGQEWTRPGGRPVRLSRATLRRWLRDELGGSHG